MGNYPACTKGDDAFCNSDAGFKDRDKSATYCCAY